MKRLFLLSVLALPVSYSFGQKVQGVYVGKMFSDRNALILEADGSQVRGAVYVNEKDRFSFAGTYNKPELKGIILLNSSKKISVEGSLKGNSLTLTFPDSSEMKICSVHKVSTKVSIDMADLFSNQYDMLLLGMWEPFKTTDPSGVGKIIVEFGLHGRGAGRLGGTTPPQINRNYSYTATDITAAAHTRWEISWETHNGLLDWTDTHPDVQKQTSMDFTIHRTMNYFIKNDTLATTNAKTPNGSLVYWKRSK